MASDIAQCTVVFPALFDTNSWSTLCRQVQPKYLLFLDLFVFNILLRKFYIFSILKKSKAPPRWLFDSTMSETSEKQEEMNGGTGWWGEGIPD